MADNDWLLIGTWTLGHHSFSVIHVCIQKSIQYWYQIWGQIHITVFQIQIFSWELNTNTDTFFYMYFKYIYISSLTVNTFTQSCMHAHLNNYFLLFIITKLLMAFTKHQCFKTFKFAAENGYTADCCMLLSMNEISTFLITLSTDYESVYLYMYFTPYTFLKRVFQLQIEILLKCI